MARIKFALLCFFALSTLKAEDVLSGMEWRLIGPFRGGRAIAVTGVPGDPTTFYFGAVGGGVWKTGDAGMVWRPIFDQQKIASIGAIEVAPSNPKIIYAGTGEADLRSDISFGDGVYRSDDGGATWANIGLRDSRQIGRIVVHPANPDLVYVAALGHAYGPNAERGVYRTSDGGRSWKKVLDKGPDVGAVDLALAPDDPQIIYAAMWRARRTPWSQYPPLGGPGSGLYRSSDGGEHWTEIAAHGLPEGEWGRSAVAIARDTRGRRVYALVEAEGGGLFRSDDGGATWTRASADPRIIGRAWYFGSITVDPRNPDVVYIPNVALYRSTDAGKTFEVVRGAPGGDDYHSLWIDPTNTSRMILGTDQGVTISLNGGKTWSTWYNQPTAQFYHVITDNQWPYVVYGSQQDSGTAAVPSRTSHHQITARDWFSVGGGESGYIAPDPRDANIVYVSSVYGGLTRFDKRTAQSQQITPWPEVTFGTDIAERKYRFPWTPPLVFSPIDPAALYYGAQCLLKTTDGGLHWREISPDLTGDQRSVAMDHAKPTVENAKAHGYGVIYTIAPSPLKAEQIWVGSDTGLTHLTIDAGQHWSNVTPAGLSDWSKITLIEASHFDPAVAYAAVDRHRLDDYRPYIYRTADFGKTWTPITSGIDAPAFVNAVREDPVKRGLLFAATELGVYVSFDDGAHWRPLQLNLPVTSVRDLVVHGDDLAIATHGRAFWILDDISPLRQSGANLVLLKPAVAIRTSSEAFQGTPLPLEEPTASNPPEGAVIDYVLKNAVSGEIKLEIFDNSNQLVRRFSSLKAESARRRSLAIADAWIPKPRRLTSHAGLNRFVWDLAYAPPAAGGTEDEEPGVLPRGPLALPGTYQVRLTVGGREHVQPLQVKLDPRSSATPADLQSQLELALKLIPQIERASAGVRELEALHRRLIELKHNAAVAPAASALDVQVESILRDHKTGLVSVAGELNGVLSMAESGDRRPPAQAYAAFEEAQRNSEMQLANWSTLKQSKLSELNDALRRAGLPTVN